MFLDVNDFRENGFFFGVWLHISIKCFRKYFDHFGVLRYFGHIIGSRVILIIKKFWRYFCHFRMCIPLKSVFLKIHVYRDG